MRRSVHIDLLMTGHTLTEVAKRYGDFDDWFGFHVPDGWTMGVHDLPGGDPIPNPGDSAGWVISGSPASVNDDLPWLPAALDAVAAAVQGEHPALGVCFGYQLLAKALGGRVGLHQDGWELGEAVIEMTDWGRMAPLLDGFDNHFAVYQSHQEIVTELPPESRLLVQNPMGLQGFQWGDSAYGVQFHPEFSADIVRMYETVRQPEHNHAVRPTAGSDNGSGRLMANYFNLIHP